MYQLFTKPYPNCFRLIPEDKWQAVVGSTESLELFSDTLIEKTAELQLEEYLGELARLELFVYNLKRDDTHLRQYTDKLSLNQSILLSRTRGKIFLIRLVQVHLPLSRKKARNLYLCGFIPSAG